MAVLLHRGKVKDFYLETDPSDMRFGDGYFHFRGREGKENEGPASIFDYGEFPFGIEGKPEGLYLTARRFFRVLDEAGIPHHMVGDMGNRKLRIRAAKIPQDYSEIVPGESQIYLIPLEVVFSRTVTPVASLHRDLRSGKANPADYGLEKVPEKGETVELPQTRVRFSTKIETVDEYREGIEKAAGLVGNEPERLKDLAVAVDEVLRKDAEEVGLCAADGKIECVMGRGRNILVGDTCYSWDENRLLYQLPSGLWVDLSKQFMRNVYTINGWKAELKKAQKASDDKGTWPAPPKVNQEIMDLFRDTCFHVSAALSRNGESSPTELGKVAQRAQDALDRLKDEYHRDETGAEV